MISKPNFVNGLLNMRRNYRPQIEKLQIVASPCIFTHTLVTMIASQSGKSEPSTELQTRMEQLSEQLTTLEEEKDKLTQEKGDLQQQLIKQKDRMLEAERDVGYGPLIEFLTIVD